MKIYKIIILFRFLCAGHSKWNISLSGRQHSKPKVRAPLTLIVYIPDSFTE